MFNLWAGTYTGTIYDQECVSCSHAGMCVQGSIGAHTVTQRSSCTHWAELLRLLNWTDQEVIFFFIIIKAKVTLKQVEFGKNNNTCA